ncbi:hypothetical protein GCM10010466_28100 [Planomonospora alba]|uniref:Uncharacterized protein n=1 Tax=Planomonospora alba TaxID=161354 RepID=A0ABP6N6K7_9ACTN
MSVTQIDIDDEALAAHHGLTPLHADNDSVTVSAVMTGLRQRDIRIP